MNSVMGRAQELAVSNVVRHYAIKILSFIIISITGDDIFIT